MGKWGGCHSVPLPDLLSIQVNDITDPSGIS